MAENNPRNPATLEEARSMLLEDSNTIRELTEQLDTLRGQNSEKDSTIEDLRNLNQRYYLLLAQGQASTDPEPEKDEEPQSLEDFAKTIKGVIR